jgi:hypothetical protein
VSTRVTGAAPPVIFITAKATLAAKVACLLPDGHAGKREPMALQPVPHLTATLAGAPAHLVADLLTALDIQVLYRPEQDQATIWPPSPTPPPKPSPPCSPTPAPAPPSPPPAATSPRCILATRPARTHDQPRSADPPR